MFDILSLPFIAIFWIGISWALGIGLFWTSISNRKLKQANKSLSDANELITKNNENTINEINKLSEIIKKYEDYLEHNSDILRVEHYDNGIKDLKLYLRDIIELLINPTDRDCPLSEKEKTILKAVKGLIKNNRRIDDY